MDKRDLKVGDIIHCANWAELRRYAEALTKEGYYVECKGWDQIRTDALTIVRIPEKKEEDKTLLDICRDWNEAVKKRGYVE